MHEEEVKKDAYSFVSKSPLNTTNSMRILLPQEPKTIILTDAKDQAVKIIKTSWDALSHTYYLSFENDPAGTKVSIKW